jgi:hypothetical protein
MKVPAVFLLILATIALLVLTDRPAKINPIPFRVLQEGETNPPLRQVGATWPLPAGTRVWLQTNQEPFGIVSGIIGDGAIFIDPIAGKTFTLVRDVVRHDWIEEKDGTSNDTGNRDK